MRVKTSSSHCMSSSLRSVPASEENGSVGDRVSAGSGSGGAGSGSHLCHSHRQCACRWILPRHHCEWHVSPPRSLKPVSPDTEKASNPWNTRTLKPNVSPRFSLWSLCTRWVSERFWALLAYTWWRTADPWWVCSSASHVSPSLKPCSFHRIAQHRWQMCRPAWITAGTLVNVDV